MDRLWGDPNRYHPIIFFGNLVAWGEKRYNKGDELRRRRASILYNSLIILLPIVLYLLLLAMVGGLIRTLFDAGFIEMGASARGIFLGVWLIISNVLVFYMLSGTTLIREVKAVFVALEHSLEAGRRQVARIVGRDTAQLSEQEVRTAALETLSENLSDGVIAPMFWFLLLGVPGILMYKMVNTQDSMIGYKNERYRVYGRFSARLDDYLNYIPARLTALLMLTVVGRWDLFPFVKRYGRAHASPNSGYPEAALAGILSCRFGGPHDYFGELIYKPYIGEEERPLSLQDLHSAIGINRRAEYLMLALMMLPAVVAVITMIIS